MRKHINRNGFTLIELLVVISIISLLSATMLVSLNSARVASRNGRITEETTQLRSQIEQSWNGASYTAFGPSSYGPALGGPGITSIVAAYPLSDTKANAIIDDILLQNKGQYGGGATAATGCGGNVVYNAGFTGQNIGFDGLTIYVYPACGPVTKYAIYSEKMPLPLAYIPDLIKIAYASLMPTYPDPTSFGGYMCVDSTGNAVTKLDGWVPGYTGVYPGTIASKIVTDGMCH